MLRIKLLRNLFVVLFLSTNLFSQEIKQPITCDGYIYSPDSTLLKNVNIILLNSNRGTQSDKDGYFFINNLEKHDTLLISHIGYEKFHIDIQLRNNSYLIFLEKSVLSYPEIIKENQKLSSDARVHEIVTLNEIEKMADIKSNYQRFSGVNIRSYGGDNALTMISSDGGRASETKVILAGIDMSNPQNGMTDLSIIPSSFLNKISIENIALSEGGSGAVDAIVKIDPWGSGNRLQSSWASFNHKSIQLNLDKFCSSDHRNQFIAGLKKSDGDFSYFWKDKKYFRKNNDFNQSYVAFRNVNTDLFLGKLDVIFMAIDTERGVPGLKWNFADTLGRRHDQLILTNATYSNKAKHGVNFSYVLNNQAFYNPMIFIDSEHLNVGTALKGWRKDKINGNISLDNNFIFNNEKLNSNVNGDHNRKTILWNSAMNILWDNIEIRPLLTMVYSPEFYEEILPSVSVKVEPVCINSSHIIFSYSNHFRAPGFNDLYWEPGGNPELKSEKTQSAFIRFSKKYDSDYQIQAEVFYKLSDNLIQWLPQQQYWRPVNITSAERYGLKMNFTGKIYNHTATQLNVSRFFSNNLSPGFYNGLDLRFIPNWLVNMNVHSKFKQWSFLATMSYTSSFISMYSYPEDLRINSNLICNGSVGKQFSGKFWQSNINIHINNIFNVYHESISAYPEPGRNIKISLSIQSKTKETKK